MAKPLITANQLTLMRLLFLPIGGWLLYQGVWGLKVALVFMTVVGFTDFLDGWLARRYGPTVLGSLMDPIADKVFIVVIYLPFMDLGFLYPWQVGLLLLREMLVTGLRSSYERRHVQLRTSLIAKIKTWAQMVGSAVICLMNIAPRQVMLILMVIAVGLPLLLLVVRYLIIGRVWRGTLVFAGWWLGAGLCYLYFGPRGGTDLLMASILAITWISAWGYVSEALPFFVRRRVQGGARPRPLDAGDWVRIAGGVTVPLSVVWAQSRGLPAVPLILTMALEIAVGGLDNLLCHHQAGASPQKWALRVGLVTGLLVLAVAASPAGSSLAAVGLTGGRLAVAACVASLLGTLAEFYRGRSYYLEEKFQSKPIVG